MLEQGSNRVVVEESTENNDERTLHLDSVELSSEKSYVIKYEFFEKSVQLEHASDVLISGGHMGAMACSQPFVI